PPAAPCPVDLQSFPTRRSSDLALKCTFRFSTFRIGSILFSSLIAAASLHLGHRMVQPAAADVRITVLLHFRHGHLADFHRIFTRSEEHTSELQSRFVFVCGLLL